MSLLKRALVASGLAILIAGSAGISAQAATISAAHGTVASHSVSSTRVTPDTWPYGACDAGRDGEVVEYNGYYYECQYVMGVGYFWIVKGPVGGCGIPQPAAGREPACG